MLSALGGTLFLVAVLHHVRELEAVGAMRGPMLALLLDGVAGGGLSLVETLVDGYGGDVRIEDNEPRGTTTVVTLPLADVER